MSSQFYNCCNWWRCLFLKFGANKFYLLDTTLWSNIFLLQSRSPRFLFGLYAMIDLNKVLRFEFICNKYQCSLIICFTFHNVSYVKRKGILFCSFSFNFGTSDGFFLIIGSLWNSASIFCFCFFFFVKTLTYK